MTNIYGDKRLTVKQEIFSMKVALERLNQSDAYACAYDVSKSTRKSVNEASSKLAAQPAIARRIEALREMVLAAAMK